MTIIYWPGDKASSNRLGIGDQRGIQLPKGEKEKQKQLKTKYNRRGAPSRFQKKEIKNFKLIEKIRN